MRDQPSRSILSLPLLMVGLAMLSSCNHDVTSPKFVNSPCTAEGSLSLAVAQSVRVDCSNGGTTVTLPGNGASYLVVAQLAVDKVPNTFVPYHVISGSAITADLTLGSARARTSLGGLSWPTRPSLNAASTGLPPRPPRTAQLAFDRALRARAKQQLQSGAWGSGASASRTVAGGHSTAFTAVTPTVGSTRAFRVIGNSSGGAVSSVGARLTYVGNNVLLYIDTLAPAGFTAAQLNAFGVLFDQTLYPIDTSAFGPPTDIDGNGHVIMLMSPAVNRLTSSADCLANGFIAGFFEEEDLGGGANDPNSNNGEIFYSIVPDPAGTASCKHTTDDVGFAVPGTFVHELQHLISFSQHVVVHGGAPEYGWLDEGLSIVAEELGSVYYEQKCPGTACRTNASQIFPDSSQGFVANFLDDSYAYALLPDTASLTLHDDSEDGFSWRGGDWLLMRWLGDQLGAAAYRRLDQNTLTGVANIESVSAQSFPDLFANFGLALVTDSMPTLPRTTAPAVERFVSRNMRQLWARLYTLSGGDNSIPYAYPLAIFPISADTTTAYMYPGTGSYYRLDTPSNAATVSIQFSAPSGAALSASLRPQLAIFRFPPGQ